jgi:MoxR-like ATPase
MTQQTATPDDLPAVEKLRDAHERIQRELGKAIVGQTEVVDGLLTALFANGHVLLVGVPGLAKTLLIRSLARTLDLSFSRIQFTPDLMPSDITGTEVIFVDPATGAREFRFLKGPIFANMILADEINRTPPKTQAAMLEAMQERKVTVGGTDHKLPEPFFVLATQNPIEQEGTYPLPEAQLDRFLFDIRVGYPTEADEVSILRATTGARDGTAAAGASGATRCAAVVGGAMIQRSIIGACDAGASRAGSGATKRQPHSSNACALNTSARATQRSARRTVPAFIIRHPLEQVAGLAVQRAADRRQRLEAHAAHLAALEQRDVDLGDAHLLGQLARAHAPAQEHGIELDNDGHRSSARRSHGSPRQRAPPHP